MAYTEIHKITATLNAALDYISGDKVEEVTEQITERILKLEDVQDEKSLNDSLKDSLDYAMNDKEGKVIFRTYTSYNCCFPIDTKDFGKYIIEHSIFWSKEKANDKNRKATKDNKEVIAWHLIQSFEESIRPELANEIGCKLVDKIIPNFPCQISTHTNTEHTHNHIIFSAWDVDGKKFHNDHKAVDLIRKISDELCQNYGLNILEDTKEMKLVKYKDADGNLHYYEPTGRKNELIRQRKKGNISKDDVNSYRNSYQYENKEVKKETVRTTVKKDIDYLIPQVSSFESLLQRLREQGYYIKDKKKNGEWLAYITYKPPTAERGVRDYKLSDDEYYKRINIEKIIASNVKEQNVSENIELRYFDKYIVGEFNPYKDIDEHTRIVQDEQKRTFAKRRSIVEREVIRDIKKQYKFYGNYDYKYLHRENRTLTDREKQILEAIQFRCDCLRFIEKKDIRTFNAIQNRIDKTSDQLNKMNAAMGALRQAILKEKQLLSLPGEIEKISFKIAANKDNEGYMATEYFEDVKKINNYKKQLQAKNLITPDKLKKHKNKIRDAESKLRSFEERADLMNREMETYNYFNDYVKAIGIEYTKENKQEKNINEKRNDGKEI